MQPGRHAIRAACSKGCTSERPQVPQVAGDGGLLVRVLGSRRQRKRYERDPEGGGMQTRACNRAGAECITWRRPRRRRWPMMEACWRACFAENGRLPAERCSAARSPGSRAWSSRSSSTESAPAPHTCRHGACLRVCQRCGICGDKPSRVIPQLLRQVPPHTYRHD